MDLPQTIAIARQVIERLHMNDRISFKDWVWIATSSTLINADASVNIGTIATLKSQNMGYARNGK